MTRLTELLSIAAMALQIGIVGVLVESARRRDVAATVNALVSITVALSPGAIGFVSPTILGRSVTFGPELPLWLAVAGLLHSYGMLGPYDSIWWWDSLTHTISAALVAAFAYSGLIVVTAGSTWIDLPTGIIPLLTILFTMAAGIFWELIELVAREVGEHFDIKPVLVHYGLRDTVLDLVFDFVAALGIVVLDIRLFVPIAEEFPQLTEAFILGSGGIVVGGSIALACLVVLSSRYRS